MIEWPEAKFLNGNFKVIHTGKSFSEALILASVNPQYDKRLFIELQYKFRTCCVQKLFFCFCFDIQNNICTQHVQNLYFSCNLMNNLSSYCGLTDSRMRASDTDLPVTSWVTSKDSRRPVNLKCLACNIPLHMLHSLDPGSLEDIDIALNILLGDQYFEV